MTLTVFAEIIPEIQKELEGHCASVDIELEEDRLADSRCPTAVEILYLCPFLMFSTIVTSFGGILFGFDTAALNGILIMPSFINVMGGSYMSNSAWADRCSWITSSLLLGAAFSSLFAAIFADTVGRKLCINISSLMIFIGACVQAFAQCFQVMIIGRVIVGAGIGLLSAAVPMYLAEVSPKSIRGAISSLFELTVAFGILLAFLTTWWFNNYFLISEEQGHEQAEYKHNPQENNWRYILIIQAAMAAILSTFLIPVPESPRWLISKGKNEKAREVLQSLRWYAAAGRRQSPYGVSLNITNIDVEYDEMLTDYNSNIQKVTASYDFSPLLQCNMLLRTSIAISIKVLQQLTGINSIMYYSSIIFESIGIRPDITTVITGLVNCVATLISVIFIDNWGRRLLLISGSVGMCLSLLIVGIIVLSTAGTESGSSDSGPVASGFIAGAICFFIINFAYSYGPIAWLYPAEIFPMHVRAKGVSISTSADWLVNFLVSKCVPIMILPHSKVGGLGGTFLFFSGCTLLMTLWAITHVHETAGLTLEDIEDVFHASSLKQYRRYMAANASYFLYFGGTNMRDYTRSLQCLPHEIPQSDTETETETVSDTNINIEADKILKLESDISSDRNHSFPLI